MFVFFRYSTNFQIIIYFYFFYYFCYLFNSFACFFSIC